MSTALAGSARVVDIWNTLVGSIWPGSVHRRLQATLKRLSFCSTVTWNVLRLHYIQRIFTISVATHKCVGNGLCCREKLQSFTTWAEPKQNGVSGILCTAYRKSFLQTNGIDGSVYSKEVPLGVLTHQLSCSTTPNEEPQTRKKWGPGYSVHRSYPT